MNIASIKQLFLHSQIISRKVVVSFGTIKRDEEVIRRIIQVIKFNITVGVENTTILDGVS